MPNREGTPPEHVSDTRTSSTVSPLAESPIHTPEQHYFPLPRKHSRWRWLWFALALLLLIAVAVHFLWPSVTAAKASSKAAGGPQGAPVVTATARKGDIGVYYSGLGAVTPFNTVTVRSRIDGQLVAVRYREGDTVIKNALLAEIDDAPYQAALTQAQGQLLRDQAILDNAKIDLARYQLLAPQHAIPEQQLATQQATVHQSEGVVKLDEGQIQTAQVNLAYCKIPAPITGRIGLRLVDPGNIVHAADTNGLLVITQMDPISVIFAIPERQLLVVQQQIAAGQHLEVDVRDSDSKTKIGQGTLTTLDNQIDPSTGTLKLRATFANGKGTLFPNQLVNARLLVQEKSGVTLLPTAAIQRNAQATYTYLLKPDSTVTVRNVTIGTTEGDDSEITSGLVPGDVVVMTGVDKLQEGSKVTLANTPASPSTAPTKAPPAKKGSAPAKAPK